MLTGPGRSAAAVLVKEVRQAHGGHQGGGQAKAAMEQDLDLILIQTSKHMYTHLIANRFRLKFD